MKKDYSFARCTSTPIRGETVVWCGSKPVFISTIQKFPARQKNHPDPGVSVALFHLPEQEPPSGAVASHTPVKMPKSNVFRTLIRPCGKSLIPSGYNEPTRWNRAAVL